MIRKSKPAEALQEKPKRKSSSCGSSGARSGQRAGTGKSTYSNQATGAYSLAHAPGTYTLKAEAYGYESNAQTVKSSPTRQQRQTLFKRTKKGTLTGTIKIKNGRTRPACKVVYR
ncbi:hypothetical protein PO124_01520 [Bacillus licheniformis]|nr:hypothetical protein [Bacillus licheniformis]